MWFFFNLPSVCLVFSFPGCFAFWCFPCFACVTTKRYGQCLCLPLLDCFGFIPPISLSMRVSMRHRYGIKVRTKLYSPSQTVVCNPLTDSGHFCLSPMETLSFYHECCGWRRCASFPGWHVQRLSVRHLLHALLLVSDVPRNEAKEHPGASGQCQEHVTLPTQTAPSCNRDVWLSDDVTKFKPTLVYLIVVITLTSIDC